MTTTEPERVWEVAASDLRRYADAVERGDVYRYRLFVEFSAQRKGTVHTLTVNETLPGTEKIQKKKRGNPDA